MTPVELSRTVLCAVRRAVDDGELDVVVPGRTRVAPPGPGGCGDYASNVALQLARSAGQPPLRVAEILRRRLAQSDGISEVVVTGPGFLNISLRGSGDALVREILRRGHRYGHADRPAGQLVQLHAPHEVRAVVVMDAVARILRSQGALVRTSCAARPEPAWTDILGAEVDAYGTPEALAPLDVNVRPAPAPADPAPLGRDAARWALLHPAPHDRPRITVDHLVQRESNPLFRVRYAHARTRALTRNAADLGFHAEPGDVDARADAQTAAPETAGPETAGTETTGPENAGTETTGPETAGTETTGPENTGPEATVPQISGPETTSPEISGPQSAGPEPAVQPTTPHAPAVQPTALHPPAVQPTTPHPPAAQTTTALRHALADHPRVLQAAAAHHAPDRLARHLVTVADAVLPFLAVVLPRGAEKPSAAHRARLALAEAAGAVLAGGLSLLGIDAPEHL